MNTNKQDLLAVSNSLFLVFLKKILMPRNIRDIVFRLVSIKMSPL